MPTENVSIPQKPGSALVVGCGVVGQTVALRLQRAGIATTVIDRAGDKPASWGNAGHIAVEQVDPLASWTTIRSMPKRLFVRGGALGLPWRDIAAWLPFGRLLIAAAHPRRFAAGQKALSAKLARAMPAWRDVLDDARARELLREEGHFVVWESEATAREGAARWKSAPTGTATVRDATAAELAGLQALGTAPLAGGVRFDGSGQIADLGQLALRLRTAFVGAGGMVETATVDRLDHGAAQVTAQLTDGRALSADIVVVAGGATSHALLRPLGYSVPLIAERGYHIQSAETSWPADMPPVVYEDRSMIVTGFHSGLRAASFVEFGRHQSPPDRRKWARLRSHVAALGLPFTLPGSEWMGARPTLPDYLPAIGRAARHPRLLYAFGHQHLGLTLAAITADAVAALVESREPPFDLAPFDLSRFGGTT